MEFQGQQQKMSYLLKHDDSTEHVMLNQIMQFASNYNSMTDDQKAQLASLAHLYGDTSRLQRPVFKDRQERAYKHMRTLQVPKLPKVS